MRTFLCIIFFLNAILYAGKAQDLEKAPGSVTLGAYYFDGWTGKTFHITDELKNNFPDRKSKWGWVTSTPEIMKAQIDYASEAGIDFFNFCWYYNGKNGNALDSDLKNNALNLYLKAENKQKISFSLLIANHDNYKIKPVHWDSLTEIWTTLFLDNSYLKANGKPLITFFDVKSLIDSFGSKEELAKALMKLKDHAKNAGLKGVSVAMCTHSGNFEDIQLAKECNFDIFTGYNYHKAGYNSFQAEIPISNLIKKENELRNKFAGFGLPLIPLATLNWDNRPATNRKKQPPTLFYTGFSKESVYESVKSLKDWTILNQSVVTKERIAMVYAWNEYEEGAWLTPSEKDNSLLEGVKKALK